VNESHGRSISSGPGGLAGIGGAQVRRDAAVLALELPIASKGLLKPAIVEFNPPPAMSNNGKPEPVSW
jgi:hypothetical protein